ncbi:hypothetical protein CC86DRAFT_56467 [Ophiobolus disseminans]|uniref:Uncharacterized protein n=1 Tax=Ophiobolus disseminans TaxID=1469910 RepID=A0A6A6ZVZ4_9PLEO|nr:hypothetical protein CC86DRAFT_56467 [Ophiobolus disseminans]
MAGRVSAPASCPYHFVALLTLTLTLTLIFALHRSPFTSTTPRSPEREPLSECDALQRLRCRALLLALPSFGALRSRPRCRVAVCSKGKPGSWRSEAPTPNQNTPADATIARRSPHRCERTASGASVSSWRHPHRFCTFNRRRQSQVASSPSLCDR